MVAHSTGTIRHLRQYHSAGTLSASVATAALKQEGAAWELTAGVPRWAGTMMDVLTETFGVTIGSVVATAEGPPGKTPAKPPWRVYK